MELNRTELHCLDTAVREVRNTEQTQELRVPEGMPDVRKVLASWGQVILRGKEWRSDSTLVTGGVSVRVLYSPEDGTLPRTLDAWVPFQLKWNLPENTPEGKLRVSALLRFVDARSVSPRKIMLRLGVGALGEAFVPGAFPVVRWEEAQEGVELLRRKTPVCLAKELGEKAFQLEEELTTSVSDGEKLISWTVCPEITDRKIIGNKVAFRGNANLHLLCAEEDGGILTQDFPMAFSQFADLEADYSADAQTDIRMAVTDLEVEPDGEGHLNVKCGLLAQYLAEEVTHLETVEDAYCPGREVRAEYTELALPVIREKRIEHFYAEQAVAAAGTQAVDVSFLPDFPRQYRENGELILEAPGCIQLLYYGEDGSLQSAAARWESKQQFQAEPGCAVTAIPQPLGNAQVSFGSGNIHLRTDQPMLLTTTDTGGMSMITGIELGEPEPADPQRPSLILRRGNGDSLWQIAKTSGSTMDAIRNANDLSGEPAPDQMLLIPVL